MTAPLAGPCDLVDKAKVTALLGKPAPAGQPVGPEKDDDTDGMMSYCTYPAVTAMVVVSRLVFASAAAAKKATTSQLVKSRISEEGAKVTAESGVGDAAYWAVGETGAMYVVLKGPKVSAVLIGGQLPKQLATYHDALRDATTNASARRSPPLLLTDNRRACIVAPRCGESLLVYVRSSAARTPMPSSTRSCGTTSIARPSATSRSGMTHRDARDAARRSLGNLTVHAEQRARCVRVDVARAARAGRRLRLACAAAQPRVHRRRRTVARVRYRREHDDLRRHVQRPVRAAAAAASGAAGSRSGASPARET